jgi:hypothetical protein
MTPSVKRVGYNVTFKARLEYDVKEDAEEAGKTQSQFVHDVARMSKQDVLEVLRDYEQVHWNTKVGDIVGCTYFEEY